MYICMVIDGMAFALYFLAAFLWTRNSQVWKYDHRVYTILCAYMAYGIYLPIFAPFLKISNAVVNQYSR